MNTSGQKLPTKPEYWEQIILNQLTQQSPELAQTMITAEIQEADYPKGNVTGYIVAANGHAIIPLVIREFRLKPFSVVLHKGTVMALTKRTVSEIMFSPEFMSNKMVDPQQLQVHNDISRLLSPPATATSGYGYGEARQANKAASVLPSQVLFQRALRVASNETKIKVANALQKDEALLSACARSLPFKSIMDELQKVSSNSKQASDNNEHMYIKRQNSSDGVGYSVNGVIKAASDLPKLKEYEKSALLLTGEVLVPGINTDAAITVLGNNMKVLKRPCVANVVCADGAVLKGVYIPRVMTFHGGPTGQGLLISPESLWCYQENIAGMPLGDIPVLINDDCPEMGAYGVFIHKAKRHALEPFKITAIYHVGGSTIMAINTMSGRRAAIEYSKDSDWDGELAAVSGVEISRYFPVSKLYKVGSIYKYVALGTRKAAARTPEEATGRDVTPDHVLSIKLSADHGFILGMSNKNSQPMTKLACQAVLLNYGLSIKQVEMMTRRAPVSFILKQAVSNAMTHGIAGGVLGTAVMPVIGTAVGAIIGRNLGKAKDIAAQWRSENSPVLKELRQKNPSLSDTDIAYYYMNQRLRKKLYKGNYRWQRDQQSKTAATSSTLVNRHRGALQEDHTVYSQGGPLRTNEDGGPDFSRGRKLDSSLLSAGSKLSDPDMLDSLLTIGMSEVDDEVLAYIASHTGDIQEIVDKLGRMLLITTTTKTELPEDILRDLIIKLDKLIWKIKDYTNKHEPVEQSG